jgi:hypothetical protein
VEHDARAVADGSDREGTDDDDERRAYCRAVIDAEPCENRGQSPSSRTPYQVAFVDMDLGLI